MRINISRSGKVEVLMIETLCRAMWLASLNFRESIEPVEIVDGDKVYDVAEMKRYIKKYNLN